MNTITNEATVAAVRAKLQKGNYDILPVQCHFLPQTDFAVVQLECLHTIHEIIKQYTVAQWALRKAQLEWYYCPFVRVAGDGISVVCLTHHNEALCRDIAEILGCQIVHEHLCDKPEEKFRWIDANADWFDVRYELQRYGWEVIDRIDDAGREIGAVVPAIVAAAGRVELGLARDDSSSTLLCHIAKVLGCRHSDLPAIGRWARTDEERKTMADWMVMVSEDCPLVDDFIEIVGQLYAYGLDVEGVGSSALRNAIQTVRIHGDGHLYSPSAIDSAEYLATEIEDTLGAEHYRGDVVTDLEGNDGYMWPTLFITELAQEKEREVGLVWVVECPSRVTVGEIITAYQIGHCERDELREAICAAAASLGIVHIDAVDREKYYTEGPMPAWYVREYCDLA